MTLTSSRRRGARGQRARTPISATRLGFDPPLGELRYWILGVPDPAQPATEELDQRQQRLQGLTQAGWHIDSPSTLPSAVSRCRARLTLRRDAVRVRLLVDDWQLCHPRRRTGPLPRNSIFSLHVTGRRADGYHELQTLFSSSTCATRSRSVCARTGRSSGRWAARGALRADLTVRAARALQSATGTRLGASSRCASASPGGGLGGAARTRRTTLLALNEMWNCGLSLERAGQPFEATGCGCACFCLQWFLSLGEGIGERLHARRHAAGRGGTSSHIYRESPMSTREVFQSLN